MYVMKLGICNAHTELNLHITLYPYLLLIVPYAHLLTIVESNDLLLKHRKDKDPLVALACIFIKYSI